MVQLALGLGSNQGNRELWLKKTRTEINRQVGPILISSSLVESAPWGYESQNWFLNQVVVLETRFSQDEIIHRIQKIEQGFGRIRKGEYADRQVDIDILLYGDLVLKTPHLTIPHAEIQNRRFVLMPLAEILPDAVHPDIGKTITQLLLECIDKEECKWYKCAD